MTTVNIDPVVALAEEQATTTYLRNRNMILAQALQDTKGKMDALQDEVAELRGQLPTRQDTEGES